MLYFIADKFHFNVYRVKRFEANESFIEIDETTLDDSGTYECIASNVISNSVKTFSLDVFGGHRQPEFLALLVTQHQ